MKLKFFNPEIVERNLKATIQKTGKLGFTIESAKKLNLSPDKSISVATNEEDENDKNLYLLINETKVSGAFPVNKAGKYFYINAKPLFDSLKMEYIKENVSFEI